MTDVFPGVSRAWLGIVHMVFLVGLWGGYLWLSLDKIEVGREVGLKRL